MVLLLSPLIVLLVAEFGFLVFCVPLSSCSSAQFWVFIVSIFFRFDQNHGWRHHTAWQDWALAARLEDAYDSSLMLALLSVFPWPFIRTTLCRHTRGKCCSVWEWNASPLTKEYCDMSLWSREVMVVHEGSQYSLESSLPMYPMRVSGIYVKGSMLT